MSLHPEIYRWMVVLNLLACQPINLHTRLLAASIIFSRKGSISLESVLKQYPSIFCPICSVALLIFLLFLSTCKLTTHLGELSTPVRVLIVWLMR